MTDSPGGRSSTARAGEDTDPAGTTPEDRPAPSRHGPVAQLLIAWSPLSLILVAYAVAQWISAPLGDGYSGGTNRLGFDLHVAQLADAERAVFGAIPTVWLQQRLVDGSAHWYDAVAAPVYVTHFVAIPLVTALLWFRLRDQFTPWVIAVVAFTVVGVTGYVVYPAAPPWLASDQGVIGPVDRISNRGWDYLDLEVIGTLSGSGQDGSNPVAAMPSLHAGAALLVASFLWPLVGVLWRAVLLGYVPAMALALVYTGEHYVLDVLAGWLTAAVAVAVGVAVRRLRAARRAQSSERAPTTTSVRPGDG